MENENKITKAGINFIKRVCEGNGNSLLVGNDDKKLPLPYSADENGDVVNKKWIAEPTKIKRDQYGNNIGTEIITTNEELGKSLINSFNYWGKIYKIDPNFLAAQAYVDSGYKIWSYDIIKNNINKSDLGSGINRFTMLMIYSIIVNNFSDVYPKMWESDTNTVALQKITNNLIDELSLSSYKPKDGTKDTKLISKKNRAILHQNIINNPDIMIQAQARYMKYISDNCNKLASASLFCYNRGIAYVSDTYTRTINRFKKDKGITNNNDPQLKEGLDYVLNVFGILGDKNNELKKENYKIIKPKKLKGYYFGYDSLFNNGEDLKEYPNNNFKPFEANVSESDEYGIKSEDLERMSIATDPRYKFIYFPENQYYRNKINKLQIVLHHTVSGDRGDVGGDIKWWRDKGEKVATSFIISRDGRIFQLFNTSYWAHHLGITSDFLKQKEIDFNTQLQTNKYLNERSIGIEIDSWGGLVQKGGDWYSAFGEKVANENIQYYNSDNGYPNGFRGYLAYERYTTDQINSVRDLILSVINSESTEKTINLTYNEDMWDVSENALKGKSGIWTHVSYREDKSDCHPQPELINMLKNLSGNKYNSRFEERFNNYKK